MTLRRASDLAQSPELMAPPTVIVPPFGVAGRVTLATLGPKEGKSTTGGGAIAEASRNGVRSALLTLDEALADSLQRLVRLGANLDLVYLDDQYEPASLVDEILDHGIEALVVDHLGKLAERDPTFGPGSQGDPILWGRLVAPFAELARVSDMAIILFDQARRGDGKYAGSMAKAGSVDILVEMAKKDGGLEATPIGRVPLPPFRVELDAEGIPRFSGATVGAAPDVPDGRARDLLQLLSDSEPEGLTYAGWFKISDMPKASFNRTRKALLRDGLALSPAETRGGRYRVTEKGETSLSVPLVPLGAIGTNETRGRIGAIGAKPYEIGLAHGTSQPETEESEDETERLAIASEAVS